MQIPLDKKSTEPLYMQTVHFIEQQIIAGNLPTGSILPSIRTLAQQHRVSKTVIAMAYAELNARGLVEGRVGQGTVITDTKKPSTQQVYKLPELSSTAGLTHDILSQGATTNVINFAAMVPSPEPLSLQVFNRCLKSVLATEPAEAYRYESSDGFGPLRQAIARHLMDRGMVARPEKILVTSGAQQAISLVILELVRPGECVVVESPCYMGFLEVCSGYGVRVVPLSVANGGLDMDQVEEVFRRIRPRLLYTMPTSQNPTGVTLSLERRRRLLELATAYDVLIFEDGVQSELQFGQPAPPALHALGGPVVHCGSFSKSFLPGLRMGYLVAPKPILRRLSLFKQAMDLASPGLLQRALTCFLSNGSFTSHLDRVLPIYRRQRDVAIAALRAYMPDGVEWTEPTGGMGIWVRSPAQVNTLGIFLDAQQAGVNFMPGHLFYAANAPANYLRLSYGVEGPQRIEQGIAKLAALIRARITRDSSHRAVL